MKRKRITKLFALSAVALLLATQSACSQNSNLVSSASVSNSQSESSSASEVYFDTSNYFLNTLIDNVSDYKEKVKQGTGLFYAYNGDYPQFEIKSLNGLNTDKLSWEIVVQHEAEGFFADVKVGDYKLDGFAYRFYIEEPAEEYRIDSVTLLVNGVENTVEYKNPIKVTCVENENCNLADVNLYHLGTDDVSNYEFEITAKEDITITKIEFTGAPIKIENIFCATNNKSLSLPFDMKAGENYSLSLNLTKTIEDPDNIAQIYTSCMIYVENKSGQETIYWQNFAIIPSDTTENSTIKLKSILKNNGVEIENED